jgi:2-C-methyl-D-erythritol 4-phosphate cytidylyltransferase
VIDFLIFEKPKQYLRLENGLSVLDQALETLLGIVQIKGCVVAIAQDDTEFKKSTFATAGGDNKKTLLSHA